MFTRSQAGRQIVMNMKTNMALQVIAHWVGESPLHRDDKPKPLTGSKNPSKARIALEAENKNNKRK